MASWAAGIRWRAWYLGQAWELIRQAVAIHDWHLHFELIIAHLNEVAIPQRHIFQVFNDRLVLFERIALLWLLMLAQRISVAADKWIPRWTIDADRDGILVGGAKLRACCTEVYRSELHLLFWFDLMSILLHLPSLQLILLMQLH